MGSNNRARRQQKQRKKQNKQKNTNHTKRKNVSAIAEVDMLCRPVELALDNNEPPPPSILKVWTQNPVSPEGEKLRTILIGFIDYLYHEEPATGQLSTIKSFRQSLFKAKHSWLYPLLFAYGLINEDITSHEGPNTLTAHLNNDTLDNELGASHYGQMGPFCAPFFIYLWVLGIPSSNKANHQPKALLDKWLKNSPLIHLRASLQKFLKLKRPAPQQKTVTALEAELSHFDWENLSDWKAPIGQLLELSLKKRLNEKQSDPALWQTVPTLASLANLKEKENETTNTWSTLRVENANTATLNLLNKKIDVNSMPFPQRVQLEAVKLRILSAYVREGEIVKNEFEQQLGKLTNLITTGIPPEYTDFAKHCINNTSEWLADEVGNSRMPPPSIERIKKLSRRNNANHNSHKSNATNNTNSNSNTNNTTKNNSDYRLALLTYLSTSGREPSFSKTETITFEHIHFPLFFQALYHIDDKNLLDKFYWPLGNEIKKELLSKFCQKLFFGISESHAEELWDEWRYKLVDIQKPPFNDIVKGHACEAETLFYTALALSNHDDDDNNDKNLDELTAEQLPSLVRSSVQLLTKNNSNFNQDNVCELLNTLSTHKHASHLFHSWEAVLTIINNVEFIYELMPFLHLALLTVAKQQDHQSERYNKLYDLCRPIPELKKLIPTQKKTKSSHKHAPKTKKNTSKPKQSTKGATIS